jgi:hypothetical protein
LKKNKQIKNRIAPALASEDGWERRDGQDELKTIDVTLPKTQLPLKIAILRDLETRKDIRCFGSTRTALKPKYAVLVTKDENIARYEVRTLWI